MNSTALDAELDVWQAAGCAVRIEYSRAVMEELRLAAIAGFNRLGHGGVEIGGVLFGVRDPGAVKILAYRPLACDYAFGPSFTLWDNDRRALEKLLATPKTDSNLSGMQPVGWYHSHTRSEILLSEKDLELFHQFFPEIWQISLVLRPYRFEPLRAGFFFREPDRSVHSASSLHEFIVKPVGGNPDMPLPGDGAPADSAPADTAPAPANHAPPEPLQFEPGSQISPCPQPPAISVDPPRELEPRELEPRELEPRPSPAAIAPNPPRDASSYPRIRWVPNSAMSFAMPAAMSAAAIAVVLAALLFWIFNSHASAGLSLREVDAGGQLRIDWNRNSRVIQQSRSGALEIEDGSLKVHDELSQEHLRAGSITYLRTTGNVVVRLLVRGADQSTLTEISRFLGPPPATAPAIATAQTIATAAPIEVGSPYRSANERPSNDQLAKEQSAKPDGAAPVERAPEQAVQPVEPVEHPSNRTALPVTVNSERARPAPAASAPARRRLVLPPDSVPRPTDPFLPAPPMIAANTAAAIATFVPQLPALLKPVDQGPPAGKIIWTGKLAKGGTIQILGDRVSQGHITGSLPGAPVRVRVLPSELTQEGLRIFTADARSIGAPEAPGAQNGWNRTVYVLNPKKAGEIGILEAPGQQNAWNRLILRAERGGHSIIVLRWERVPAEAALHETGNQ
jgi:hypothetical protein